jgi:four helix bundle protein
MEVSVKITRFEEIEAWQQARLFSNHVYEATRDFRFERDPDLRRQMRRATVSIMSNIAEGFDGGSDREFGRFLMMAGRSATEVQSHLYVALDQGYLSADRIQRLREEATRVKSLILGFIRYLRRSRPVG